MRKAIIVVILFQALSSLACSQSTGSGAATQSAEISFNKTTHDYGTIQMGSDGNSTFVFKNTGREPLILNNVSASCGCTVPVWPREPINYGDSAEIKVKYNTRLMGNFSKTIVVHSNAINSPVTLRVTGTVERKNE